MKKVDHKPKYTFLEICDRMLVDDPLFSLFQALEC